MATKITFGNAKGGVGKTAVTNFVAYHLAELGKKVLMLDVDPQGNLTQAIERKYGVPSNKITLYEALEKNDLKSAVINVDTNLDYIPSEMDISDIEDLMKGTKDKVNYLRKKLKVIENNYDFILFDVPPHPRSPSVKNALGASDYFIVVTNIDSFSMMGIKLFYETAEAVNEYNKSNTIDYLGILINIRDKDDETYELLNEKYNFNDPDQFFKTVIPKRARMAKYNEYGIYNYGKGINKKPDMWEMELREIGFQLANEILEKVNEGMIR